MSLGWGICAQWGEWGFLMACAHPLFFSTPSKPISLFITKHFIERPRISSTRDLWLKQNSLKFCSEPLLMVYKIEWVYLLLCQGPICKTGSNDVYFKGSCLMSFERIFKRCNTHCWNSNPRDMRGTIMVSSLTNNDNLYQLPLFIALLRFPRILRFSYLKPGGFTSGAPNENIVQNHFNMYSIVERISVFKR